MFAYIWPMALLVLSNTMYQICAKSVPETLDPFASLTVTYLVGAAASTVLFFALRKYIDQERIHVVVSIVNAQVDSTLYPVTEIPVPVESQVKPVCWS